jgi:hypothetical protein
MDIFKLLKIGSLDKIELGLSLDTIYSKNRELSFNKYNPRDDFYDIVLKSDYIELYLRENDVKNITINMNNCCENLFLTIYNYDKKINNKTTMEEFIKIMYDIKIKWKVYGKYCRNNIFAIMTEGHTTVEFISLDGFTKMNRIFIDYANFLFNMKKRN